MSAQLRTGCNKRGCKEGENEADENRWQNPLSDRVWAIGLSTNRIPATGLKRLDPIFYKIPYSARFQQIESRQRD